MEQQSGSKLGKEYIKAVYYHPAYLTYTMEFSRQDYWSGKPFSSSGDLLNPGIEPGSPTLQADCLSSEPPRKPETYGLEP